MAKSAATMVDVEAGLADEKHRIESGRSTADDTVAGFERKFTSTVRPASKLPTPKGRPRPGQAQPLQNRQ
jgi:hypothetical protein